VANREASDDKKPVHVLVAVDTLLLKADKLPKTSTTTTAANETEIFSPTGDPTEAPLTPRRNGGTNPKGAVAGTVVMVLVAEEVRSDYGRLTSIRMAKLKQPWVND
jgi:hypothetical protein